jgi:hypothetical protein
VIAEGFALTTPKHELVYTYVHYSSDVGIASDARTDQDMLDASYTENEPIVPLAVVWGQHCVIGSGGSFWRQSAPLAVNNETESRPGRCLFLPHST